MSTNKVDATATDFTSPPWVLVPGIANFRDIGGYGLSTGDGSVRRNLVFRSADPSKVTEGGRGKLKELGIKKLYDLRSEPELKRLGDRTSIIQLEGVERCFVPVIRNEDYSPQALNQRYQNYMHGNYEAAYRHILSSDPTAYRTIFQHLLSSRNPDPCLIHCTVGKDRTGVICALILMLAGVKDEDIAADYGLTMVGLVQVRENLVQYLMQDKKSMAGGGRENAENMLKSRPESMMNFLTMVRTEYGSVGGYMKDVLGFTPEEIETIRLHLVCEEKPIF